ncbi:MAG: BCCT family transporter [Pseudomonadota bacterium]
MTNRPGWVFFASIALLAAFVATGAKIPLELARGAEAVLTYTQERFGWLYLFATTGFLVFCLGVALSSYGQIRLGADGEAPEFAYPTWLGMIFSAGMGVGLVFWGVAEPMSHYVEPPLDLTAARSPAAAELAMRYSLFHWGFHQWANFAIVGLAIAYVSFRRQRPGLISETFRESLGDRVDGGPGHAINTLAVVSTVFGVATTLGLGIIQINSGLAAVGDVGVGLTEQLWILGSVALVFLVCALTPLEKGVRWISNANMWLAGGILAFVFFAGPTNFITAAATNAIGGYADHVVGMSLVMTPYTNEDWVERWTIFYWAWGISWAPFVGSFIARISRGRTVREFVLGVIGVPVVLSILWFATFGGTALYFELFEAAGISDAVVVDIASALFVTLEQLPFAQVLGLLMVTLVVLFVITSANSATFVLGMFVSGGALEPARWIRFVWGIVPVAVCSVLLLSGGLDALRTVSILAAFPFIVLMMFMAAALLRSLRAERRQQELHEAILWAELERLLEARRAAERDGADGSA